MRSIIINMNFEQNMNRIEEIISSLTQGEIDLDNSVELYQEGLSILNNCKKQLDEAQQKISSSGSNDE